MSNQEIRDKLAGYEIHRRCFQGDESVRIGPAEIEPDGRKAPRAMRALIDEGFLKEPNENDYYPVTDLAYSMVDAVKPDLLKYAFRAADRENVHLNDIQKCLGAPWASLTLPERKWIVEHPKDYEAFYWNDNWAASTIKPFTIGDRASLHKTNYSLQESPYITDATVHAERAKRARAWRFNFIKRQHLGWGLTSLGLAKDEEYGFFIHRSDITWGSDGALSFDKDPASWPEDFVRIRKALRERIEDDLRRLEALYKTQMNIMAMGGWEKFHEAFDKLIENKLDEQDEDDVRSSDRVE